MTGFPIWQDRIVARPDVLAGKPCIRDTRVSVEAILDTVAVTGTVAATAGQFPRITEDDVRAALAYAADALSTDDLEILASSR